MTLYATAERRPDLFCGVVVTPNNYLTDAKPDETVAARILLLAKYSQHLKLTVRSALEPLQAHQ